MKKINHIIRLLNSNVVEVKFKHMRDCWGECDYESTTLFVNKRLCTASQITTLVHECLHFIYPFNDEEETLRLEKETYDALTFDETNLLRDFLRSKE